MQNKELETRISKNKVQIDAGETKSFFLRRTEKVLPHRYNYVLNQDEHPELAIQRDAYSIVACGPTWDDQLENRTETLSYFWILQS